MASEAPPFWWEPADWRAALLWPVSAIYGAVAAQRLHRARRKPVEHPVLCVGNFTVGGAGKTPVAIALAKAARKAGRNPGFLSRGHGGSFSGPQLVDLRHDTARHTGDEPLLLARAAPVAVSPDRAAGADLLTTQGCDFLIMDDGFQSARIAIDYALIVIDAARGLGNGHVIPGGPMRAPLLAQLRHTDAVLRMGDGDGADGVVRQAARAGRPIFEAATRPVRGTRLKGRRFFAFAGIGHPAKFFGTIEKGGGILAGSRSFPDHYLYTDEDLADLASAALAAEAELVTTAKDAVRLQHGSEAARAMREEVVVVEIETVFELDTTPSRIVESTLDAWRRRMVNAPVG